MNIKELVHNQLFLQTAGVISVLTAFNYISQGQWIGAGVMGALTLGFLKISSYLQVKEETNESHSN